VLVELPHAAATHAATTAAMAKRALKSRRTSGEQCISVASTSVRGSR